MSVDGAVLKCCTCSVEVLFAVLFCAAVFIVLHCIAWRCCVVLCFAVLRCGALRCVVCPHLVLIVLLGCLSSVNVYLLVGFAGLSVLVQFDCVAGRMWGHLI